MPITAVVFAAFPFLIPALPRHSRPFHYSDNEVAVLLPIVTIRFYYSISMFAIPLVVYPLIPRQHLRGMVGPVVVRCAIDSKLVNFSLKIPPYLHAGRESTQNKLVSIEYVMILKHFTWWSFRFRFIQVSICVTTVAPSIGQLDITS